MALTKTQRVQLAKIEALGVEVVDVDRCKGTHRKIRLRYKDEEFYILSSAAASSDVRGLKNMLQTVRGAKRAIDTGDETLWAKFITAH